MGNNKQPLSWVMTNKQYLEALGRLELTPHGKRTAMVLGLGLRQAQRFASGEQMIIPQCALLVQMYLRYGLPEVETPPEDFWSRAKTKRTSKIRRRK